MMYTFLFLVFLSAPSFSGDLKLNYDPSIVKLTGTLDLQTFPGPPNYEDISKGDEVEKHFYLKLNQAVDVVPKGKHPATEGSAVERNVRILQLAIDAENDALWAKFRKVGKGGIVTITGSLFQRFTGHHHSRVLMDVTGMEPN